LVTILSLPTFTTLAFLFDYTVQEGPIIFETL
jgi:hypothetical protein